MSTGLHDSWTYINKGCTVGTRRITDTTLKRISGPVALYYSQAKESRTIALVAVPGI